MLKKLYRKFFTAKVKNQKSRTNSYFSALVKANKIIDSDKRAGIKIIYDIFLQDGINITQFDSDWWFYFIRAADYKRNRDDKSLEKLKLKIKDLENLDISISKWLELYYLSLRTGLSQVAYWIQEILIKKLNSINNFNHYTTEEIKIFVLIGIKSLDRSMIKKLSDHLIQRTNDKYNDIANFVFTALFDEEPSKMFLIEKKYQNYIANQSIAIVGPKPTKTNSSDEINAFDKVVKFNYHNDYLTEDSLYHSERCDLSYYSGTQVGLIRKLHKGMLPDKLDWAIILNHGYRKDIKEKNINHVKVRQEVDFRTFFLKNLTGLPRILLELGNCKTKEIKIFNLDLMITKERFENYRLDENRYEGGRLLWLHGAFNHDSLIQYQIVSSIYNTRSFINGDENFKHVMDLGPENYMLKMQEMHGVSVTLEEKQ